MVKLILKRLGARLTRGGKVPTVFMMLVMALPVSLLTPDTHAQNIITETYISLVNSFTESITRDYQEKVNTSLETKQVEYNGQVVTYQYQLWRLRPHSVCAHLKHELIAYSQCGISAKQLFQDTCTYLNDNPNRHWRHAKLKNLYCAAAVDYSPVIAEARISKSKEDTQLKQRQQCSVLRMEALRTRDPRTVQLRDQVCGGEK